MPCKTHANRKQSNCSSCNSCKHCVPLPSCKKHGYHVVGGKRGRPSKKSKGRPRKKLSAARSCTPNEGDLECASPGEVHPLSRDTRATSIDESTSLALRVETSRGLQSLLTGNREEEEVLSRSNHSPRKKKLLQLLIMLDLPIGEADRFPLNGFSGETLHDQSSRKFRRAQQLRSTIVQAIDNLLCTEGTYLPHTAANQMVEVDRVNQLQALRDNTEHVALLGEKSVSLVANALLAGSFRRLDVESSFVARCNTTALATVKGSRKLIGRRKYTSLRKVFTVIQAGNSPPRQEYTYRVPPEIVIGALEYVMNALQVVPGASRNITFGDYGFRCMPVYERGGWAISKIFEGYKTSWGREDHIGRDTFSQLTQLLTKRGESQTGLSTYYVRLKYASDVYIGMLKRLIALAPIADFTGKFLPENEESRNGWKVRDDCNQLLAKWDETQQFMAYEFSEKHLNIDSVKKDHCCRFAVNKESTCTHTHEHAHCKQCVETFNCVERFRSLLYFIDETCRVKNVELDKETKTELATMEKAAPFVEQHVVHYLAHRLRAKVQFTSIRRTYSEITEIDVLIVMDHKQKVLPMMFREGQVEYFGKRGMSLLGAMMVRRTTREINGEMKTGLEYVFIDIVIDKYSTQDSVQVLAAMQVIVTEHIKQRYPEIRTVTLQSDNASCFATHDAIPFVHHLNAETRGDSNLQIVKWINTEAQTGKGRLDTHFSFVNTLFKSYVQDGNNILTEDDIFNALCFQGGVTGATAILINGQNLHSFDKVLRDKKEFKTRKTGVREKHEVRWNVLDDDNSRVAHVITLSELTKPEVISNGRLNEFPKMDLMASATKRWTSEKKRFLICSKEKRIHDSRHKKQRQREGQKPLQ
jgi:hypothetical protein